MVYNLGAKPSAVQKKPRCFSDAVNHKNVRPVPVQFLSLTWFQGFFIYNQILLRFVCFIASYIKQHKPYGRKVCQVKYKRYLASGYQRSSIMEYFKLFARRHHKTTTTTTVSSCLFETRRTICIILTTRQSNNNMF